MPRFRCYQCPAPAGRNFEFEADDEFAACPRCGAGEPAVQPLVDVHFMVVDPKGVISGHNGLRQYVACEPKRDYLATAAVHYAATDVATCVTCPRCRGTKQWQEAAQQYRELRLEMRRAAAERGGPS